MSNEHNVLILRDVLIPGGRIADITIINGVVRHVGAGGKADQEIICKGKKVLPAGTDLHVHMRDGVQNSKETWESGTKSAIAGGVTVVVDQPNTIPPLTTPRQIRDRINLAHNQSYCQFAINGAVIPDADFQGMWREGVFAFGETFAGPSSYGEAVDNRILTEVMEKVSEWEGIMTIHAEQVTEGTDKTLITHDSLRSVEGEMHAVQDIIKLNTHNCRLHFCHLSSAEAVKAVPSDGTTIEVTPHHLFLSYEQFSEEDAFGKVNPPLRTQKVRKDLFSCWDRIDIIASDHAPHVVKEKKQSFEISPSGIPGVETMIPLLMGWERDKKITIFDIINKTSIKPSEILGIKQAGFFPGDRADFAVYPEKVTTINPDNLHSLAGWTPYEGMKAVFPGQVILQGNIVFDEGEFFKPVLINQKRDICGTASHPDNESPLWIPGRGYSLEESIIV